jgi:hypothetical protein
VHQGRAGRLAGGTDPRRRFVGRVFDRNAALLKDWPGLGTALDDLLGERVLPG